MPYYVHSHTMNGMIYRLMPYLRKTDRIRYASEEEANFLWLQLNQPSLALHYRSHFTRFQPRG